MRRASVSVGLAALLALSSVTVTGCFGKFALTRKVYGFNDGIGNKFAKSLVFWGLMIVPVYAVCGFLDIVVFNLVEFWGGSNPIADARDVDVRELEDGSVEIRYAGERFRLVPKAGDRFVLEREGVEVGSGVLRSDGGLDFHSDRGSARFDAPGQGQVDRAVARYVR